MSQSPEEGFKVTDRRRRDDATPRAAETSPHEPADAPPSSSRSEQRSLADLFLMVATDAMVALGDVPDPATGQRVLDLPHAAQAIDLLLLLRDKTEGNRTADETRILGDLLYDLQLRYVHATKSSG
jgi:hypothetical protein